VCLMGQGIRYIRALDFHFYGLLGINKMCLIWKKKESITGITKYLIMCLICGLFLCCGISLESRQYAVAVTLCIHVLINMQRLFIIFLNPSCIEAPVKYMLQSRKEMRVVLLTPVYLFGFKEVKIFWYHCPNI